MHFILPFWSSLRDTIQLSRSDWISVGAPFHQGTMFPAAFLHSGKTA